MLHHGVNNQPSLLIRSPYHSQVVERMIELEPSRKDNTPESSSEVLCLRKARSRWRRRHYFFPAVLAQQPHAHALHRHADQPAEHQPAQGGGEAPRIALDDFRRPRRQQHAGIDRHAGPGGERVEQLGGVVVAGDDHDGPTPAVRQIGQPGFVRLSVAAAPCLGVHILPGTRLDQGRPRHAHGRRLADHHHKIRQRGIGGIFGQRPGQIGRQRAVEVDLALIHQPHHQPGEHGLGQCGAVHHRVGLQAFAAGVALAEGGDMRDAATVDEGHGQAIGAGGGHDAPCLSVDGGRGLGRGGQCQQHGKDGKLDGVQHGARLCRAP